MTEAATGVLPGEPLARFIMHKKWFSLHDKSIRSHAFEPYNGTLSVFRIHELEGEEICRIGTEYVAAKVRKTLYGWGCLPASAFMEEGLQFDADDTPPRHANVIGWPEEKHAWKSIGQRIRLKATLHLLDQPTA